MIRPDPHRLAPVLALVLVNVFGTLGQYQWARHALSHDQNSLVAAGFAATLESISLFLTAEASRAMLANDRSGTLRLGAYAVGALVGCMNYAAHAGRHWSPTAMAIAFGALSALSPILWTIHTRGVHRDALRAEGLIDPRAVKLPLVMWLRYPGRAFGLFSLGVWSGENRPAAVRALAAERDALAGLSPVDALHYAFGALGHYEPHAARVWLQARGVRVTQADLDAATAGRPAPVRAVSLPVPVSPAPVSAYSSSAPPAASSAPAASAGPVPAVVLAADDDHHSAMLAACSTKREALRYAYSVIGEYDAPAARAWLAERGVSVSRSEAHAVIRAASEDTGTFPAVSTADPAPAPAEAVRINGHAPELAAAL